MYMPATAMPLTARQISAGSRPSLNAIPKEDSALSALLARKIVRAGTRSVSATNSDDIPAVRAGRADVLGAHRPASTLIVGGLANPDWKVEVEAVAIA
jgi:enamine deaminase RidA (YjgF/YER057c/UK114 family)